MAQTIVNLAQNFVGSNNLSLLAPSGQYGTREQGGKNHASPRYIFTEPTAISKIIFNPADEALLNQQKDDNQLIEPEWYMPVVPMLLINGAEGIGTGVSPFHPHRYYVADHKPLFARMEYNHPLLQPYRHCYQFATVNGWGRTGTYASLVARL